MKRKETNLGVLEQNEDLLLQKVKFEICCCISCWLLGRGAGGLDDCLEVLQHPVQFACRLPMDTPEYLKWPAKARGSMPGACFPRWWYVTKMSGEEDESLMTKKTWKRTTVKHSTPAEVSTFPQNTLGLSPMLQKSPGMALFFEEQPPQSKGPNTLHRLQRSLSMVSDPGKELSSGSRFTFPTRRLSTIPGSEDSAETLHPSVILPAASGGKMRDSTDVHKENWKMAREQAEKHQGSSRASAVKSKTKQKLRKQLVDRRVRAWELRQLLNIEEATTHELTIEEVQTWK